MKQSTCATQETVRVLPAVREVSVWVNPRILPKGRWVEEELEEEDEGKEKKEAVEGEEKEEERERRGRRERGGGRGGGGVIRIV